MKKLIIQIPCLNEADTLPSTLARSSHRADSRYRHDRSPRHRRWLDGCDGRRSPRGGGVAHHLAPQQAGAGDAFTAGIDAALKLGADFIVNTDGDNQYAGADIAVLVAPLVRGEADVVIGDRNVETLRHLSWTRKRLQHLGSWVVRQVSKQRVPDTTSGFRAYTREAALRMNYRLGFHLHAGVDHPGRQKTDGDRARADPLESQDTPVAPVRQRVGVPQAIRVDDRAHLHDVRAVQGVHDHRAVDVRDGTGDLVQISLLLSEQ
jgi:hypothetical protein